MSRATLHVGNVLDVLPTLAAGSVRCCVTSPPYWGLRDYGHEGQLGLEPTPEAYVASMVQVFREVRRVLADDGTLWLNLGDRYAATVLTNNNRPNANRDGTSDASIRAISAGLNGRRVQPDVRAKNLIGIPWRVAFALQADGWVLRQDIVWSKPNPMPESVRDRCTKAHEFLFLFAKGKRLGPERTPYDDISTVDAAWLASVFDCEGSLVVRREADDGDEYGCHAAQVSVGNTSRALVDRVASLVGEGSVLERPGTNAPMFYWQTSGKRAAGLLRRLYPFFVVKQRQARCLLALESRKMVRGGHERLSSSEIAERDAIWEAVKSLNHFGDPDISGVPSPQFGHYTSQRYYYDAAAIAEPSTGKDAGNGFDRPHRLTSSAGNPEPWKARRAPPEVYTGAAYKTPPSAPRGPGSNFGEFPTRNARTVWTIPTQPYPEAHFATFPEELPRRCILAGSAPGDTVLDPFAGSGTTLAVAIGNGRNGVGIELNPEYAEMARRRIGPMFCEVAA